MKQAGIWNLALGGAIGLIGLLGFSARSQPYSFTTIAGQVGVIGSADGTNRGATFDGPHSVAVAGSGAVYVADQLNHIIRQLTPAGTNWLVTTIAGQAGSAGSADGL